MTLLRHVALVSGLLLGVSYSVASYVETRRPLEAAPRVAEQESAGYDAADSNRDLILHSASPSIQDHAARTSIRMVTEA